MSDDPRPNADYDAGVPQVIGPDATDYRNEFGVFADRRSDGLGITLLLTAQTLASAERDAANAERQFPKYPILVAKRTVTRSPWANVERYVNPSAKCADCGGTQVIAVGLPDIYAACPTCVTSPALREGGES